MQGAGGAFILADEHMGPGVRLKEQDAPKAQAHKRRVSFHKRARTAASRGHFTKEIQCGA